MRVLLLCTAVAGAFLLGRPSVQAETVNPLYVAPPDTQTNPMAESSAATPATPKGPVKWSAPDLDSQQKKGAMSSAQSNPLYKDSGNKGANPLHEPKETQGNNPLAEKTAPAPSPANPDGADAAVWPHMHQTATHKREAGDPAQPSPGQPPATGAATDKGIQHLHKEGIVHRDLAARTGNPGDAATDDENARADEARERASQDARQAAQPPMMPPVMPPPVIDGPKGGMR